MTLPILLFQGIPTAMALSILILTVNNSLKYWKTGLVIGALLGVMLFFIRLLPVAFGIHTLIMISLYIIVFRLYFKFSFLNLIKAMLIGILIIVISEAFIFVFLSGLLSLTIEAIFESSLILILVGWIEILLLLVISLIIYNRKKRARVNEE